MRALGFDYGSKFLGIAIGETAVCMSQPLKVVHFMHKDYWKKIEKIIAETMPDILVVGIPCTMENEPSKLYNPSLLFAYQLTQFQVPVHTANERLSSMEARRMSAHIKKQSRMVHAWSAKIILDNWYAKENIY